MTDEHKALAIHVVLLIAWPFIIFTNAGTVLGIWTVFVGVIATLVSATCIAMLLYHRGVQNERSRNVNSEGAV